MGSEQPICGLVDWGVVDYAAAAARQQALVERRKAGELPDLLIFCQHPHVITLGRNARREHLLLPEAELAHRGVQVHVTNRGGDVTYHGPGQLVGYPIVNLSGWRRDVVGYVRALEEVLIRTARAFGVEASRKSPPAPPTAGPADAAAATRRPLYTGVWVGEEKLAAIGVHVSRWVTSHGFALNVTTDLAYFDLIVPCGLAGKRATSLARLRPELVAAAGPANGGASGESALLAEVKRAVAHAFGEVFGRELRPLVIPEGQPRQRRGQPREESVGVTR